MKRNKNTPLAVSENERDAKQTITKLDDHKVLIKNKFGVKTISLERLLELTWPGDEILSLAEVISKIDNEIGGAG